MEFKNRITEKSNLLKLKKVREDADGTVYEVELDEGIVTQKS